MYSIVFVLNPNLHMELKNIQFRKEFINAQSILRTHHEIHKVSTSGFQNIISFLLGNQPTA